MAREAFGPRLDLHLGGEDLCFPHHENELALATALDGSEGWCDAFRHVGKVTVGGGGKMSKSDGTAVDARTLCTALGPRVLRLWFLSHRWTAPLAYEGPDRVQSTVRRTDGLFAALAGERARESLMHRPPGRDDDPFSPPQREHACTDRGLGARRGWPLPMRCWSACARSVSSTRLPRRPGSQSWTRQFVLARDAERQR